MEIPALIKILIVFITIVALTRFRINLGILLMLGGIMLSVSAGMTPVAIIQSFGSAVVCMDLWLLIFITALIVVFGHIISEKQTSNAIMSVVRNWGGRHGRAFSLMVIPAVLGLIPMPGGALFSAPLIAQSVNEEKWCPGWKSAINYWFRHVWEYWWPLYPVTMITLSLFPIATWQYTVTQFPLTIAAVLGGYFIMVHPHIRVLAEPATQEDTDATQVRVIGLALLSTILGAIFLPAILAYIPFNMPTATRKMLAVLLGLGLGLSILIPRIKTRPADLGRSVLRRKALNIYLIIVGVMVFRHMLEMSGLLPAATRDLLEGRIPLMIIIIILPFLAGLITGIALGFAGAAFPLVAGLLAYPGSHLNPLSTVVLAFASGYAGMMLSPLHLCLILTRQYFSATAAQVYRYLIPCVAITWTSALLLYFVLRFFGL